MHAVVVGGSGQIGGWLLRTLVERGHSALGTYASVPFSGLIPLDASDQPAAAALVASQRPDVVFYPAGFTWVDGCERDRARARSANLEQPLSLARAAADSGARFVYFSTDYVFDGRAGPYNEEAVPNPLSVYGQVKREAELALAETLGTAQLTVRTSWVFGPERQGKNFSYQLARSLSEGRRLDCPSDQVSTPSYGPDVARAVILLAEARCSGLIHVSGPEVMDRARFARCLASAFAFDPSLIQSRTTGELGAGAPRPLRGGLSIHRLESLLPAVMRPLAQTLPDFLARQSEPTGWSKPLALPAR